MCLAQCQVLEPFVGVFDRVLIHHLLKINIKISFSPFFGSYQKTSKEMA